MLQHGDEMNAASTNQQAVPSPRVRATKSALAPGRPFPQPFNSSLSINPSPTKTMKAIVTGLALMLGTVLYAPAADVEANWNKHCASCHGKDGSGDTKMGKKAGAKDYRDPAVQASIKPEVALKNVKQGMKEDGKEKMKPFADKLSDDEIKELIAYIKKFEKK